MRLVLASTSPRRRELLSLLHIPFEIRDPAFEERLISGCTAKDLVARYAQGKADSVAEQNPEVLVLASDTLIQLDGEVLGKPTDLTEARSMLRQLSGRVHHVHTAVALSCLARHTHITQVSTARVWMKPFSAEAHERYLSTGDSFGKAGAYSIQGPGSELIERLDGDFTTVVGFPLRLVADLLTQSGVNVSVDLDMLYELKPYGNWHRFGG
jgi:septum formation protein